MSSSIGIILLLIPISGGGITFPWSSPISISMLVLGSVSMVIFVGVEARWARMPLLPLRFFANAPVCAILVQNVFIGMVYSSNLYFLPIYFQTARQWSPTTSAALLVAFVATQSTFSILSGQYISRQKRYGEVIWLGYGLMTLGCGLYLLFRASTQPWSIVLTLIVSGAGMGLVFQPTLIAAQAHTAKEDRAVVISARNFTRSVGGAVGLAVSSMVFTSKVDSGITSLPSSLRSAVLSSVFSSPDLSSLTKGEAATVVQAYILAGRALCIIWVALSGFCLLLCVLIKDRGLQRPQDREQEKVAIEGAAVVPVKTAAVVDDSPSSGSEGDEVV